MAGHDFDGEAADECCAAGEERQPGKTSSATPSLRPSCSELTISTPDSSASRSLRHLADPLEWSRSSTQTHLLHCVFLI
jgi:hypothetical protein